MNGGFGLAPMKTEGGGWNYDENRPATAEEIAVMKTRDEQEWRDSRRFRNRLKVFFHEVGRAWHVLWTGNDGY